MRRRHYKNRIYCPKLALLTYDGGLYPLPEELITNPKQLTEVPIQHHPNLLDLLTSNDAWPAIYTDTSRTGVMWYETTTDNVLQFVANREVLIV
jgi:hypothetical protein